MLWQNIYKTPWELNKNLPTINNFRKVAGHKTNPHKSSAFPYVANKTQQEEIERKIAFKLTADSYLGVCLSRHTEELYEQLKNTHCTNKDRSK